jgi:hypothetical protein
LEKREEQVLPGSEGVEGRRRKWGSRGRDSPNKYTHMNECINN